MFSLTKISAATSYRQSASSPVTETEDMSQTNGGSQQPLRQYGGLLLLLMLSLAVACARVRPLSGGDPDVTPPVLLRSSPADSSTGLLRNTAFEFFFDKALDRASAAAAIRTYPHTTRREVRVRGGHVTVRFPDSLPADTTFVLVIGKTLQDQKPRDNKLTEELTFLFSTADSIRAASLRGRVSIKGEPTANGAVQYEPIPPDSAKVHPPRRYPFAAANPEGLFRMVGIPPGRTFVLRGFEDRNHNRIADLEELQYVFPETLVLAAGEVRRAVEWNLIDPFEKGSVVGVVINRTGIEGRVAIGLRPLDRESEAQASERQAIAGAPEQRDSANRGSEQPPIGTDLLPATQVVGDSLFPGFAPLPQQDRRQSGYETAYALLDSTGFKASEWRIGYATLRGEYSIKVSPGRHWIVAFVDVARDSVPGLYVTADSTERHWEPLWTGDTLFVAPGEEFRATTIDLETNKKP